MPHALGTLGGQPAHGHGPTGRQTILPKRRTARSLAHSSTGQGHAWTHAGQLVTRVGADSLANQRHLVPVPSSSWSLSAKGLPKNRLTSASLSVDAAVPVPSVGAVSVSHGWTLPLLNRARAHAGTSTFTPRPGVPRALLASALAPVLAFVPSARGRKPREYADAMCGAVYPRMDRVCAWVSLMLVTLAAPSGHPPGVQSDPSLWCDSTRLGLQRSLRVHEASRA